MNNAQNSELMNDIKKLFEQNKKARIVQIKTEERIIAKINRLLGNSLYPQPERSGGRFDMEMPE